MKKKDKNVVIYLIVAAIIVSLSGATTAYFGNNILPKSPEELAIDCMLLTAMGINIVWLIKKGKEIK